MGKNAIGLLACFALQGVALSQAAPASIALVIDSSGSLGTGDLDRARELAIEVLAALPAGSDVAVFTFDDQSRLILARTTKPDEVRKAVDAVRTSGRFTALHDALYDASRYLRDAPARHRAIVLLTDGRDENSTLTLEDGLRVAQELDIPVFTVGVGRVEERVLRRIAKLTSGAYATAAEATGAGIADRLLAAPATPETAVEAPGPPLGPAAPSVSPGASAAPATAEPSRPAASLRRLAWLVAGSGSLLLAALLVAAMRWRSAGRAGSTPVPEPEPAEEGPYSQTVLARMNISEDVLERTMILRERPVLAVTAGPATGRSFELSTVSTTSLGRARANDIVLPDVSVSSQHCRIRPEDGALVLHDLKSTNGTYVNDRRVTRHTLADGDVVKLGETAMLFRTERKLG
jgi:hypothetical protein